MFLSHQTIQELILKGEIVIQPEFDKRDLRPAGIRVHLARHILVPEPGQLVDLHNPTEPKYKEIDLENHEFILEPNQFVLGATYEAIQTPTNVLAVLDGRSTIARIGLTTHVTASTCDGTLGGLHVIVLELKNLGNFKIKLNFKDPIAMVMFAQLDKPVMRQTTSQYGVNQSRVTPPNLKFKTGVDN